MVAWPGRNRFLATSGLVVPVRGESSSSDTRSGGLRHSCHSRFICVQRHVLPINRQNSGRRMGLTPCCKSVR